MTEPKQPESTIAEELSRLGAQVAEAMRLMWESDERQRLQEDLSKGVQSFAEQLGTAAEQAGRSETTQEIKAQAKKVAERLKESSAADEVRTGLINGLAAVNEELKRLIERLDRPETQQPD
jgi:hypothetical protein